ncbi:MarR family transcriptional regulator [Nocardia panacis]|uniref:MarR family transcriptional regulator n=1 Tax=Nocardia panacis TaxID=2340916 RepID=A0A3A4KMI2_9NOCA|nr:MarR family winged helix-turn-helix transcriptional regulator [Nocardia panacis]RJO75236.1 MarR family transcriptional regulator [Nocardia panacis]
MTADDQRTAADLLDAVGPAFGKLRRTALLEVDNPISAKDLSRTLVLNLVLEHSSHSEVTVGMIAELLGSDPSVASRMVSDTIKAGYLTRAASQQDGRRTILQLSDSGRDLMTRFRKHQRDAYDYITADWSEHDRLELARLLVRYVDSVAALKERSRTKEGDQ